MIKKEASLVLNLKKNVKKSEILRLQRIVKIKKNLVIEVDLNHKKKNNECHQRVVVVLVFPPLIKRKKILIIIILKM